MVRFGVLGSAGLVLGIGSAARPTATFSPPKFPAEMTAPRSGHSATLLPDGRVLIAGGMVHDGELLASAEIFDPRGHRFTATVAMPSPRLGHTATLLKSGKVLIAGGLGGDGGRQSVGQATAVLFDPATGSWQPTGSATLLRDGRVLVAGGYDDHGQADRTAWILNPSHVDAVVSAR